MTASKQSQDGTVHVSGHLLCPSSGVSTVHSALVCFMLVFDDRFQAESGWNLLTLLGSGHKKPA